MKGVVLVLMMSKVTQLVFLCLVFTVLSLSSCGGSVPEVTTKSVTQSTPNTISPNSSNKPFPTEILSPNDSLELVSVTPSPGTTLRKSTRVLFKVTVNYRLNSVSRAFIRADLGIESGSAVGIARVPPVGAGRGGIEILQGSGTLVIEDEVDIDFLTEKVNSEKVYLILSLYYFKSETQILLVYRVLKEHYFLNQGIPFKGDTK